VSRMAHPNRSLQRRTDETEIAETVATTLENPQVDSQTKRKFFTNTVGCMEYKEWDVTTVT